MARETHKNARAKTKEPWKHWGVSEKSLMDHAKSEMKRLKARTPDDLRKLRKKNRPSFPQDGSSGQYDAWSESLAQMIELEKQGKQAMNKQAKSYWVMRHKTDKDEYSEDPKHSYLYWSNDWSWGSFGGATVWSDAEKNEMDNARRMGGVYEKVRPNEVDFRKMTVKGAAMNKQTKIASLEARIAKLQSKVASGLNNKRVFIDVRGPTLLLDFRADLKSSKMHHKFLAREAKTFGKEIAKTIPKKNSAVIFDGVEVYSGGLTLLQTIRSATVEWNVMLKPTWLVSESNIEPVSKHAGELERYLESRGWRVTYK